MSLYSQIKAAAPEILGRTDLIEQNQDTADIIKEVCEAHEHFAPDYDKIAKVIYEGGYMPEEIPALLFDLLKKHVRYEEEPESTQTTRSPKLLLTWGHGDCKHYSGFIAGVLDAYNRIAGKKVFKWAYRFASYDIWSRTPKHVFVVLNHQGKEIWLDPVLKTYDQRSPAPTFVTDKVVSTMALKRLSGVEDKGVDITTVYDRSTALSTCSGINNGEVVRMGVVENDKKYVNQLLFVSPSKSKIGSIGAVDWSAYDRTPAGSFPPGSNGFFPMGYDRDGMSVKATNGYTYQSAETLIPGVHYLLNGEPYNMPPGYSQAAIPEGVFTVEYPAVYNGKSVPLALPKPLFVGNKIVLLPKPGGTWAFGTEWGNFLARVIMPLAVSHGVQQWWVGKNWPNIVNSDLDFDGWTDYVTGLPQYLPGVEFMPEGVQYFADTEKKVPLYIPPARNTMTVDQQNATPPPPIPPGLTVVYPLRYRGKIVPEWMPRPIMVDGQLQLLPKRASGHYENELRADGHFWLAFLTSVFMPLVSGFTKHPYNTKNEKLTWLIVYDTDNKTIINYLNPPEKDKEGTFLGNLIRSVIDVVKDVAAFGLKFAALGPRTAFLGLVRLNVTGFATNLKEKLGDSKMIDTWKQIGGSEGDLRDAIEDGSKKAKLIGSVGCNCAAVGAEPISVGAALAAAAPIIAIMAAWLKGQIPEAAPAIDAALNAMNRAMFEAGYDPLGLGNNYDKEVTIADPNSPGNIITVPPAPPIPGTGSGFFDSVMNWIRENKLLAGAAAVGIGYMVTRKKRKRNLSS